MQLRKVLLLRSASTCQLAAVAPDGRGSILTVPRVRVSLMQTQSNNKVDMWMEIEHQL